MSDLATLIEQDSGSSPRLLEQAIFNTNDAPVVATKIVSYVESQLGEIKEVVFYSASVGIVVGLRLASGDDVVVKIHRWNVSITRLRNVQRVQAHLSNLGLAVPRPLVGPTSLGNGIATIEEMRRGDLEDGHDPGVREVVATGLYKFVSSSSTLVGRVTVGAPLVLQRGDELWPEPHDPRFDFIATSGGAGWIDDLARRARRRLFATPGDPSIGHFDWRVQNLGFTNGALSSIYDWDSVATAPEPVIVGCASSQFTAVWNTGVTDPLPSLDEMRSFVDIYERARARAFTESERELLDAANLWSCAYGARCQHSDSVLSGGDQTETLFFRLLRERSEEPLLK